MEHNGNQMSSSSWRILFPLILLLILMMIFSSLSMISSLPHMVFSGLCLGFSILAILFVFCLKCCPKRFSVTVGYVVTGETSGAHETIIKQVKRNHLKVIELDTRNQHQCQSIIVFCPITSRAGSNVEAVMSDLAVSASDKSVFLVLMHHTRDVDLCTAEGNCSERFPRVVSEVHFLFHETQPGLLDCPKNSQAINELKEAISTHLDLNLIEGQQPSPEQHVAGSL